MRSGCRSSPRPRLDAGQRRGDAFRLLSGVSSECFYELTVDVDCGLRLAWADSRLAELTGYAIDELVAMGGFFALVAAADLPELHRRNQRLLVNQPGPIRYRLRRKSGELRLVQDHARAERAPGSDVVCRIVGTLADVSDSGWAAVPRAALEREAALLGGDARAPACSCSTPMAGCSGPRAGRQRRWATAARACRPGPGLAAARRSAATCGSTGWSRRRRRASRCAAAWAGPSTAAR